MVQEHSGYSVTIRSCLLICSSTWYLLVNVVILEFDYPYSYEVPSVFRLQGFPETIVL